MANDAKQAITLFRQYATDPQVIAVLGPTNSVGFVPLVPVAGQIKLPSIGNGSGAPIKEWNPYGLPRQSRRRPSRCRSLLQKVVAKEGIKRLAVIYDQTQDAQAGDAKVCKDMAGKLGYEIVGVRGVPRRRPGFLAADRHDPQPEARTPSTSRARPGDGIKVVSQIREAGIDKRLLTGYGSFQDPVYWDGTKGQCQGRLHLARPGPARRRAAR